MKRFKKVAVSAFTLLMAGCMSIPAYAEEQATYLSNQFEVQTLVEDGTDMLNNLRYQLIYLISIGLTCKNETAYIYAEVNSYDEADLNIAAQLQQKKNGTWKTIKTFYGSATNDRYCYVDESYPVTSGYDYRVVTTNYVDDGINTETVTKTGNVEYCY